MQDLVVGIDLGTTNSLVGIVVAGHVRRFADERGDELLPSAVGTGPAGELLVGRPAKNRRLLDPARTAISIKRSMGRDCMLRVGDRQLTPPQISALILGALLDRAEAGLGARPSRAIITVPAYFDDAQRQATRDAGEIAGLTVERLVNEPTAAALSLAAGAEERLLVYDLGGGTFDVSVLERDGDVLEVSASHGDTQLGGDDIDRALYGWVLEQLGAGGSAVERDVHAKTRVLEAVERAKIALSDREEVRLFDPFVVSNGPDAVHLDLALSRATLAKVSRPFIERTLFSIDCALRDAKVTARDLDRVVLVGGSSRLTLVAEMVSAHLDVPAQLEDDADRAVVNGAALLAGRAMGEAVPDVLIDITPHTLAAGVVARDEAELIASPIIARGTVVPTEQRRTYYTVLEDQFAVDIPIAQGEAGRLEHNTPLGEVRIEDLPPSPAHSPVEVCFQLDLSGVLHVTATHLPSGRSAEVRLANSPYRLTSRMREQSRQEVDALRALPSATPEAALAPDLALAKAMVARAARALSRPDSAGTPGTPGTAERDPRVERARAAQLALTDAIERRSREVVSLTESLSDALLDLI